MTITWEHPHVHIHLRILFKSFLSEKFSVFGYWCYNKNVIHYLHALTISVTKQNKKLLCTNRQQQLKTTSIMTFNRSVSVFKKISSFFYKILENSVATDWFLSCWYLFPHSFEQINCEQCFWVGWGEEHNENIPIASWTLGHKVFLNISKFYSIGWKNRRDITGLSV